MLLVPAGVALVGAPAASAAPPPIKHVFVIFLENKTSTKSFPGAKPQAPYLSMTLPRRGQLLENFYGIAHFSLG